MRCRNEGPRSTESKLRRNYESGVFQADGSWGELPKTTLREALGPGDAKSKGGIARLFTPACARAQSVNSGWVYLHTFPVS